MAKRRAGGGSGQAPGKLGVVKSACAGFFITYVLASTFYSHTLSLHGQQRADSLPSSASALDEQIRKTEALLKTWDTRITEAQANVDDIKRKLRGVSAQSGHTAATAASAAPAGGVNSGAVVAKATAAPTR